MSGVTSKKIAEFYDKKGIKNLICVKSLFMEYDLKEEFTEGLKYQIFSTSKRGDFEIVNNSGDIHLLSSNFKNIHFEEIDF